MYFIVIIAFAFLLSDDLPPLGLNLFASASHPGVATITVVAAELLLIGVTAFLARSATIRRLRAAPEDLDRASNVLVDWQRVLMGMIGAALTFTMLLTPWNRLVRQTLHVDNIPLVEDLVVLAPFVISLLVMWIIIYPAEVRIRIAGLATQPEAPAQASWTGTRNEGARAALTASKRRVTHPTATRATYLIDKFRHQFLIIGGPMLIIVFAKHYTYAARPALTRMTGLPWIADSLLGLISLVVLSFAPVMLRYIWATEPLPDGPLRRRLEAICRRIGLKYREILLWHTHGLTVNAAVMGFFGPLRYIMISDALLETMDDDQIEAVFGHEAGHVRHFHLQFFLLFVLLTMYVSGGAVELLRWLADSSGVLRWKQIAWDPGMMQLVALSVLGVCWLFGFGWISRQFERQADLFGVRCLTSDIRSCVDRCPVHGVVPGAGLCIAAVHLFGRTLTRIADLNGIPREAASWRHGSIQSRCVLLESLLASPDALEGFDRRLRLVKIALVIMGLIGTTAAGAIYYEQIVRALRLI